MINKQTADRLKQIMPFLEPITYSSRTSGDTFKTYSVPRARRKKVNKQDKGIPPDILVEAELIWQIVADELGVEPKLMDVITDSGSVSWTVIHVVEQLNGTVNNILAKRQT